MAMMKRGGRNGGMNEVRRGGKNGGRSIRAGGNGFQTKSAAVLTAFMDTGWMLAIAATVTMRNDWRSICGG
jgi:hypothetical protein